MSIDAVFFPAPNKQYVPEHSPPVYRLLQILDVALVSKSQGIQNDQDRVAQVKNQLLEKILAGSSVVNLVFRDRLVGTGSVYEEEI